MPSGSHGGNPGGHGGGSSFGGGRSFGGGGYHHRSRPPRMRPYYFPMFGHTYVIGTAGYNRLMSLIGGTVMVAFAAIMCLIISFSQSGEIKTIKEERARYLDMVAAAKANPDRIIEMEVTDQFVGAGGKYYITYNYKENENDPYLWADDGYSFSLYTREQATAIYNAGTIEVAVARLPLTAIMDSVPMDYENFELEDDGSYVSANRTVTIMRVISGVMAGVFVLLLVLSIRLAFSHKQTEEEAKVAQAPVEEQNKKTYCAYCGGVMTEGQDSCPRCGARMKK